MVTEQSAIVKENSTCQAGGERECESPQTAPPHRCVSLTVKHTPTLGKTRKLEAVSVCMRAYTLNHSVHTQKQATVSRNMKLLDLQSLWNLNCWSRQHREELHSDVQSYTISMKQAEIKKS